MNQDPRWLRILDAAMTTAVAGVLLAAVLVVVVIFVLTVAG